jgi:hypothetical protein
VITIGIYIPRTIHVECAGAKAMQTPADGDFLSYHDVVFGLVEVSDPENVSKACPNGFAVAKSEESFVAGLVSAITFTLYTPTDVAMYCAAKK